MPTTSVHIHVDLCTEQKKRGNYHGLFPKYSAICYQPIDYDAINILFHLFITTSYLISQIFLIERISFVQSYMLTWLEIMLEREVLQLTRGCTKWSQAIGDTTP